MKGLFITMIGMIGTTAAAGGASSNSATPPASALLAEARVVLNQALLTEEAWPRIHAAEALVAIGESAPARELCEKLAMGNLPVMWDEEEEDTEAAWSY